MTFQELLQRDLSGDIIRIINDEFAIGTYAIEGEPRKRSSQYVFARTGDKLYQFCLVSSNFNLYKKWFEHMGIATLPDLDIYKNNQVEWRDRNKRFMKLITTK